MTRKAEVPVLYGEQLIQKRPAVHYQQGIEDDVEVTIRDSEGQVLDLDGSQVMVKFADGVLPTVEEASLEIQSPTNPLIFIPPESVRIQAGVWTVSVGVFRDAKLKHIYNFWLYNEPSPWISSGGNTNNTLPQLDELRSYLRDTGSFENELFEKYQYFLSDICEAIVQTVRLWNSFPPLHHTRTTRNFNYPYLLKLGIEIHLMESILEWARKNRLPFQGTVAVDDLARFDRYEQLIPLKKQEWQDGIIRTKAIESIAQSFRRIA